MVLPDSSASWCQLWRLGIREKHQEKKHSALIHHMKGSWRHGAALGQTWNSSASCSHVSLFMFPAVPSSAPKSLVLWLFTQLWSAVHPGSPEYTVNSTDCRMAACSAFIPCPWQRSSSGFNVPGLLSAHHLGWSSWETKLAVMVCFALSYPKGHLEKGISPIRVHIQTLKHIEGKQDGWGLPSASLQEESVDISALSHHLNYCSLPCSSSFQSCLHTPTSLSKDLACLPASSEPPDWWLSLQPPILPPYSLPPTPLPNLLSLVLPLSSCSPRAPARRQIALQSSFQAKWSLDVSGRKGWISTFCCQG